MQSITYSKKPGLLQEKQRKTNSRLENEVIRIFRDSRNNYGSRKIKIELKKLGITVSRKKISSIIKKYNLVFKLGLLKFATADCFIKLNKNKMFKIFTLDTQRENFYNITSQVNEMIKDSGVTDGFCVVYCPHTTAGIQLMKMQTLM